MANGPNVCKVDEIFISIFIYLFKNAHAIQARKKNSRDKPGSV